MNNYDDLEDVERLIRLPQVAYLTGLSRATIYKKRKDGLFPEPVRLGVQSVAWRLHEIKAWIKDRTY